MKPMMRILLNFCFSWTGTILIVLIVIAFFAQAFIIPTRSMVGTLFEGDMLFVKKITYGIPIPRIPWLEIPIFKDVRGNGHIIEGKRPSRGDVVVFIPPDNERTYYVKRVFGTSNDEVIFTKEGYYLRPSGGDKEIQEKYNQYPKKVFLGKVFVLDPFIGVFGGISYKGAYYAKDEASKNIRPIARQAYYLESNGYFYTKECATALSYSDADKRFECSLFTKKFTEDTNFEYEQNITYEELIYIYNNSVIGMTKLLDNEGNIIFYTKLRKDEFFMAGDNRNNSYDSRFFGVVPYKNIIGTPMFIYFSFNKQNSQEANAEFDESKRYTIRWERMFKGMREVEKLSAKYAKLDRENEEKARENLEKRIKNLHVISSINSNTTSNKIEHKSAREQKSCS